MADRCAEVTVFSFALSLPNLNEHRRRVSATGAFMQEELNAAAPAGFSMTQIVLHWLVVVLVAVQFLNHEAMEDWWRDATGGLPEPGPAMVHIIAGTIVLVLMVIRLAIRWRVGAPAQPEDYSPLLKRASEWAHYALYGIMLLLPLTGLTAVFVAAPLAEVHDVLTGLFLLLLALHVLGALYHLIFRRDGVFKRIFVPR